MSNKIDDGSVPAEGACYPPTMLTLTQIQFAGYRSFPSRIGSGPLPNVLPLRPLTLIIGKNGAGKSQVLRLVQQVVAGISRQDRLPLPDSDHGQLFSRALEDSFHLRSHAYPLSVRLGWSWNGEPGAMNLLLAGPSPGMPQPSITVLSWRLAQGQETLDEGSESLLPWDRAPWSQIRDELRALWAPAAALTGFRDRIRTTYPVPQGARGQLGVQGERCVEWLYQSEALRERVRDWIGRNLPPSSLEIDSGRGELRLIERRGGTELNFADAAEGLHQVLPVVTLWSARALEGGAALDAVEQPELHLHDAIHAELGDLALAAAGLGPGASQQDRGQRLLVETHSEGLLLRVRRRIAEGTVSADQVSLAYVDRDARGSRLVPIPLTPEGDPEFWPPGVFLERLAEARAISAAHRRPRSGVAV